MTSEKGVVFFMEKYMIKHGMMVAKKQTQDKK